MRTTIYLQIKNKISTYICLLLVLLVMSCSKEKYTVIFIADGPSIPDMEVSPGTKLLNLPDPKRENHFFCGWYVDRNHSYRFDNYTRAVNTSLILYGRWEATDGEYFIPNKLKSVLENTALVPYLECTINKSVKKCSLNIITDIQYNRVDRKIFFNNNINNNAMTEWYYFDATQADLSYNFFKDGTQEPLKYKYSSSWYYLYGLSGLKQILGFSFDTFTSIPIIIVSDDGKVYDISYNTTTYKITINDKQVLQQVEFKDTGNNVEIRWDFRYGERSINFPSGYTFADFVAINSRRITLSYPMNNDYPINQQFTLYITPRKGGFFRLKQEEAEKFAPNFLANYSYSRYKDVTDNVFSDYCIDYLVEHDQDVLYAILKRN